MRQRRDREVLLAMSQFGGSRSSERMLSLKPFSWSCWTNSVIRIQIVTINPLFSSLRTWQCFFRFIPLSLVDHGRTKYRLNI